MLAIVEQANLTYNAPFVRPAFGLYGSYIPLMARLCEHLSPFGVTPATVRNESGPQVADYSIACLAPTPGFTVRLRLQALEVFGPWLDLDHSTAILSAVHQALSEVDRHLAFNEQTTALLAHVRLGDGAYADWAPKLTAPWLEAPLRAVGVNLIADFEAGVAGSIDLQPSYVYGARDGSFDPKSPFAFIRLSCVHPGSDHAKDVASRTDHFVRRGLETLGLELRDQRADSSDQK